MGVRVDIHPFRQSEFWPLLVPVVPLHPGSGGGTCCAFGKTLEREFWPSNHGYSMFIGSFWLYPLCGKESRETCILSSKDLG